MSAPPPAPGALPPLPPNIGAIAAPQIFGALFNFALYGVLVMQSYVYRTSFPTDNGLIRFLVYFILVWETVQTALNGVDMYKWFGSGFGNILSFSDPGLSPFYTPMMGSLTALFVQWFFCYRIWIINRKIWWFVVLIALISLMQAIAGFIGGVEAHITNDVSKRFNETGLVYTWLVGDAVADTLIAITMTVTLLSANSMAHSQSNDIVVSIVRLTVETNALSAGIAIISLILFAGASNTTYFICPTLFLGKIYANTLLATFNNRAILRQGQPSMSSSRFQTTVSSATQVQSGRSYPFSAGLKLGSDPGTMSVGPMSPTEETHEMYSGAGGMHKARSQWGSTTDAEL